VPFASNSICIQAEPQHVEEAIRVNHFRIRASVASLVFAIVGGAATAQSSPPPPTQYTGTIRIDCYRDGDTRYTGTGNAITITIVSGFETERITVSPTDHACSPNVGDSLMTFGLSDFYGISRTFSVVNEYPVQYVRISTNGDDGFWIDQLSLAAGPGSGHWGVNGERGYCLSTDPSDATRSWRDIVGSRGCQPCMQFNVGGGVTSC